jgi:hypothetical protein
MGSAANDLRIFRPVDISTIRPPNESKPEHLENEMPRRSTGELDAYDSEQEIRDFRLAMTAMAAREATRPSEFKRLWLPICAAVIISLGPPLWQANVMTRSNNDDLKTSMNEIRALVNDAKRDASDAAKEAKRANNNYALLDTYNRELERALIRKGIPLPTYPILEK